MHAFQCSDSCYTARVCIRSAVTLQTVIHVPRLHQTLTQSKHRKPRVFAWTVQPQTLGTDSQGRTDAVPVTVPEDSVVDSALLTHVSSHRRDPAQPARGPRAAPGRPSRLKKKKQLHVEWFSMQSAAVSQAPNPGPRAPPSTISATPATQNDGGCEFVPRNDLFTSLTSCCGCEFVPRLPRETTVDVRLCHACHAKCRGVTGAKSGPKGATQYHKCHACHAKRRWM